MPNYTYKEIINHIAELVGAQAPGDEALTEGLDLNIDHIMVSLIPSKHPGGLIMELQLGVLLHPIPRAHLEEMVKSNFLGMNTGGCTLALDDSGSLLFIRTVTTAGTSPQEQWEWLHRLLAVGRSWMQILAKWHEFVPLVTFPTEEKALGSKV